MKVLHLTPTFFDRTSVLGGGERYAYELARAMSEKVDTELVSFADQPKTWLEGRLRIRLLKRWGTLGEPINPLPWGIFSLIRQADVIQCYQHRTFLTDAAILAARACRKAVFMADMGGGSKWSLSYHMNLHRWLNGFLLLSNDCIDYFPYAGDRAHIVYGGVDTVRFAPNGTGYRPDHVLFVGRLIPAKGVEVLIPAVPADMELTLVGQVFDPVYRAHLETLAQGRRVHFFSDLPDSELAQAYSRSLVTVLPSNTRMEKLGLVLLESMACGTPVICSRIGGMPEIVKDGETGFIVPPGDSRAIEERIRWLREHPSERERMGRASRSWVLERFTWDRIAENHLQIYQRAGQVS